MPLDFSSERDVWEFFHGPEGRSVAKALTAEFKERFPKGHKESIRPVVELCTDPSFRKHFGGSNRLAHMLSFHPRAFPLLLEYGQDYTPIKWKAPPDFPIEPEWTGCFKNSYILMREINATRKTNEERSFVYVEGLVDGASSLPMLHAWNASTTVGKKALDWTWYTGCHWSRYFGIPFTEEEHQEACSIAYPGKTFCISVLHRKHFEKVEYFLHQLLGRRKECRAQEKLLGT
ncbi:MAG: hypothetical protein WD509_02850 [Candidatus Paceibacterota bacterium]